MHKRLERVVVRGIQHVDPATKQVLGFRPILFEENSFLRNFTEPLKGIGGKPLHGGFGKIRVLPRYPTEVEWALLRQLIKEKGYSVRLMKDSRRKNYFLVSKNGVPLNAKEILDLTQKLFF